MKKPSGKRMFRDQWGYVVYADTVKELRYRTDGGGARVSKMYRDMPDGTVKHVGYIVGDHWYTEWKLVERAA